MRARFKAPYNIPQTYNLPWSADYITVINPTKYTVYIRVGAQDIPPDTVSADLIVFPASFATYPVDGNLFGLVLKEPSLLGTQSSMPSTAFIHFSSVEQPPISNAIQLPQNPSKNIFSEILNFSIPPNTEILAVPQQNDCLYREFINPNVGVDLYLRNVLNASNYIHIFPQNKFVDMYGMPEEVYVKNFDTATRVLNVYSVRYF